MWKIHYTVMHLLHQVIESNVLFLLIQGAGFHFLFLGTRIFSHFPEKAFYLHWAAITLN